MASEKPLKPGINFEEFIVNNLENLTHNSIYSVYNDKFNIEYFDNNKEKYEEFTRNKYRYFSEFLNSLCVQLYQSIVTHGDTITIFSYSTGYGFIEAYFANWLKFNGKCRFCNIIYSDPLPFIKGELVKFNVFDDIDGEIYSIIDFRFHMFFKNETSKNSRNNCRKIFETFNVDIFLAFQPQDFTCNNPSCKNRSSLMNILKLFMLIGDRKLGYKIFSNPLDPLEYLQWTKDINMFWIFMDSKFVIDQVKFIDIDQIKAMLTNKDNSYYKDMEVIFPLLRDNLNLLIGPLFNITDIFNLLPITNTSGTISFVLKNIHNKDIKDKGGGAGDTINNSDDKYKIKYLKYKTKYLSLKKI